MKKFALLTLVIGSAVVTLGFLSIRVLGPRLISVDPPSGVPIGEFESPLPETSLLAVNIALPLEMLSRMANENAPDRFSGEETREIHRRIKNGAYAWEAARGEIQILNTGEGLAIQTPFAGAARFRGEIDARILTLPVDSTVELQGTAGGTLTPVLSPDWQIDPRFVPSLNLSQASLNIGGLGNIDISNLLSGSLGQFLQQEVQKLAPSLGKHLDFRQDIDQLWREAYRSQFVSENPPVWISVTPQAIYLAPLDYSNPEQVSVNIGIQSATYITNRDPGPPVPQPLPDLNPVDEPVATELNLPLIVSVVELNEVLKSETFEFDTGVGGKIEIGGMETEIGQEGFMNLKLTLKADQDRLGRGIAGDIWVKGRPVIDIERQTLGFTDVTLTVETRDALSTTASWLLEGMLVRAIESQLRIDLNNYKAEIDEEVQKAIAEATLPEGLEVSLQNLDVTLSNIYTVTKHSVEGAPDPGIVIVIRATGSMTTRFGGTNPSAPEEP